MCRQGSETAIYVVIIGIAVRLISKLNFQTIRTKSNKLLVETFITSANATRESAMPEVPFENDFMQEMTWLGAKASQHGRQVEGPQRGRKRENTTRNTGNSENSKFGEISVRDIDLTNVRFKQFHGSPVGHRFS